jgi:hypothetical protein
MTKQTAPTGDESAPEDLPTPENFLLTVPLYRVFKFDYERSDEFSSIERFNGTLDMYCPGCGASSVFSRIAVPPYSDRSYARNLLFPVAMKCSRDNSHRAVFMFYVDSGEIQKIGQLPSMADLEKPDFRKYQPVLGAERLKELTRGIGLVTHGVGVGAFVYLRRVFEWLIEDARVSASKDLGWSDEAYVSARMEEKINLLKTHLPPFLVQNRGLYGVLSVGVHTLSEEDCLKAFPAVLLAI